MIFSTIGGYEFAVNRFTREIAWRFTPMPQQATIVQTELFGDIVYHDGGDRFLYALRAADGTLVWKAALHNQPIVDFVVTDKYIYVTDDPKLIILERATGRRVALVDEPQAMEGRFLSTVALADGRIFIASKTAATCLRAPR